MKTKFSAIALGVVSSWSMASAGGCYPAYSGGTSYSIGSWVSASITTTTPVTYTACSPPGSGTCPSSGFETEGGASTTKKYNFQCISEYWCSQSGFSPSSVYSAQAWSQESSECSGTATLAPTKSPVYVTLTDVGGCPPAFTSGTAYAAGDRVSFNKVVYGCKAWPQSLFCPLDEYKPDPDSTTDYWQLAWEAVGYCDGTIAVTNSPTIAAGGGGCPSVWAAGGITKYKENDQVSVIKTADPLVELVYKCKAWPYSGYCGLFSPLDAAGGSLGWDLVGGCTGTIKPTATPTLAPNTVVIDGCPGAYNEATTTYKAGSQVTLTVGTSSTVYQCREWPNEGYCNQKAYAPGGDYSDTAWTKVGPCTGTIAPTGAPTAFSGDCMHISVTPGSAPVVKNTASWTSGTMYEAGDQVRIGGNTYQCKPWPYFYWCRMAAYQPTTTATGLWTEAWSPSGPCKYVSLPPTNAPTAKPTAVPTDVPTAKPTAVPTAKPTAVPTAVPTAKPT